MGNTAMGSFPAPKSEVAEPAVKAAPKPAPVKSEDE
jgi:hypothetical protein